MESFSNASEDHFDTMMAIIRGTTCLNEPVISNMMIISDTVILVTPDIVEAAPTIAYIAGSILMLTRFVAKFWARSAVILPLNIKKKIYTLMPPQPWKEQIFHQEDGYHM